MTYLSQDLVQGFQNELHEAALGTAHRGLFRELAAVGDQRGEEQELQPASIPTESLLLPPSPLLPPIPLGSCQGHMGQAYSK